MDINTWHADAGLPERQSEPVSRVVIRGASAYEAPHESNFQPGRKLPPFVQANALTEPAVVLDRVDARPPKVTSVFDVRLQYNGMDTGTMAWITA